jgi:hypothetical protein
MYGWIMHGLVYLHILQREASKLYGHTITIL